MFFFFLLYSLCLFVLHQRFASWSFWDIHSRVPVSQKSMRRIINYHGTVGWQNCRNVFLPTHRLHVKHHRTRIINYVFYVRKCSQVECLNNIYVRLLLFFRGDSVKHDMNDGNFVFFWLEPRTKRVFLLPYNIYLSLGKKPYISSVTSTKHGSTETPFLPRGSCTGGGRGIWYKLQTASSFVLVLGAFYHHSDGGPKNFSGSSISWYV